MRTSRFIFIALLIAPAWTCPLAAQKPPAITLTFGTNTVTASGITPGKSAVFFASGLAPYDEQQRIVRYDKVASDDARSGQITVTLDAAVERTTIWAVVDLTDGRFAVASPPGFAPRRAMLPAHPFHKSGPTAIDEFAFDHPVIDLLYVHPGTGAWIISAQDGHAHDRDGANGTTLVSLADAVPAGNPQDPPATEFTPGGILIAIDWYHMSVLATRLDGAILGGAQ